MDYKEIFCSYLEETAYELRALPNTKAYIDEVCECLIEFTKDFQEKSYTNSQLKTVNINTKLHNKQIKQQKELKMLVLSRKLNESIHLGDDIILVVTEISSNQVKIAIEAPKDLKIYRHEIWQKIQSGEEDERRK